MQKETSKKFSSETSFSKNVVLKDNVREPLSKLAHTTSSHALTYVLEGLNKKHSQSLCNLTYQVNKELTLVERNIISKLPQRSTVFLDKFFLDNNDHKLARRCVLNLLLLNAWRSSKNNFKSAQEKIQSLSEKLKGYEMQVYLLRQLLSAEKNRVESVNKEVQELVNKVEESNRDMSMITQRNEELEKNFNDLLKYCSKIEDTLRNQENDIITSRLETANWENQLEKEREKLKKMEQEEKVLKEKIQYNEKLIQVKDLQIDELINTNADLQLKLEAQVSYWDETMAQVDLANIKLKEAEANNSELQKEVEEKGKAIEELKLQILTLEQKLREEDEKNGLLGKAILEKSNELSLVQNQFLQLSKRQYPWSGGIIKMASLCAKIPVACICTVGSLLLPFPSNRL